MVLEMILICVLGFIFGCLATYWIIYIGRARGILRIDHSNPEKDLYRFEIDDLSTLDNKRSIELRIDHNADFSRE